MTVAILTFIAGCATTWHMTRKRTTVRVARNIHMTLERRDRVQRFKRNAVIALVALVIVVALAVAR